MMGRNLRVVFLGLCLAVAREPAALGRGGLRAAVDPAHALLDLQRLRLDRRRLQQRRGHGRRRPADRERLRRHQRQRDQGLQIQRQRHRHRVLRSGTGRIDRPPCRGNRNMQLRAADDHRRQLRRADPGQDLRPEQLRRLPYMGLRTERQRGRRQLPDRDRPQRHRRRPVQREPLCQQRPPDRPRLLLHVGRRRDPDRRRSQPVRGGLRALRPRHRRRRQHLHLPDRERPRQVHPDRRTPLQAPGGRLRVRGRPDPRQPLLAAASGRRWSTTPKGDLLPGFPLSGSPQRDRRQRRQRQDLRQLRHERADLHAGRARRPPGRPHRRPVGHRADQPDPQRHHQPRRRRHHGLQLRVRLSASYGSTVPCAEGRVALGQLGHPGQRRPLRAAAGIHLPLPGRRRQRERDAEDRRRDVHALGAAGRRGALRLRRPFRQRDRPRPGHPRRGADDLPRRLRDRGLPRQPGCLHLIAGDGEHRRRAQLDSGQRPAGRAAGGDPVPLRPRRDQPERDDEERRLHLHHLPVHRGPRGPVPQRPRPPADGRRPAARLPRLRAGLGR